MAIVCRSRADDTVRLPSRAAARLSDGLTGRVILPQDSDYDDARAVWNGLVDRRPALIIRCRGAADVIDGVDFVREHGLLVSVRGGGHHVAGTAVCEDGVVLDLSQMKGIHVDPARRTARAQPGVIWGELDREAQAFGLATPGGVVSDTGVAGLTLGGGMGWLRRKHGLSCDNLISADVVTADGRRLTASREAYSDLFWALKGGSGNFGVVTSFEYRLHPVGPRVMCLRVFYHGGETADILRQFRQYTETAPEEVSLVAVCGTVPDKDVFPEESHGEPFVMLAAVYAGPVEEGAEALAPLRTFEKPIADLSGAIPYREMQSFLDADYPSGDLHYYWKSVQLAELSDEALAEVAGAAEARPSPRSTVNLWHQGGAMGRVTRDESAYPHRDAPYLLAAEANWEDPGRDEDNVDWARSTYRRMQPYSQGGSYVNFESVGDEEARAAYGDQYRQLAEVKAEYDPDNVFRVNHNVHPSD